MNDVFIYPLTESSEYQNIIQAIKNKKSPLLINGLIDSQKANITYSLFKDIKRQIIIVCHNEFEARMIYDDLRFYLDDKVFYLPFEEIFFYRLDAKDKKEEGKKINILSKLCKEEDLIIVTSIQSVLRKYTPKQIFKQNIISFNLGDSLNTETFLKKLVSIGYERVSKVESLGQFSVRGGIIDIYSPNYENPIRIELFDDEIDSIRIFDFISQRSIEKLNNFEIVPAREFIYPEDINLSLKKIKSEIKDSTSEDIYSDIEKINQKIYFEGIENFIDYFYDEFDKSIFSYMKENALIILNEPSRIQEKTKNILDEFKENYKTNLEKGFVLKSQANLLYRFEDLESLIKDRFVILKSLLLKTAKGFNAMSTVNFNSRQVPTFNGKINLLIEELKYLKNNNHKILLVVSSKERAQSLYKSLLDEQIECSLIDSRNRQIQPSQIFIICASISSGFVYTSIKYTLITDKEIFGAYKRISSKKKFKKGEKIESFLDLNVGDYVVHENHGIGKYVGMEQLKVNGVKKDYMKIVYAGSDSLYIPTDQMDKVQKYIGAQTDTVKLNKLGTSDWNKAKSKVKKAVEDMAKDLIELYAKREKAKGYKFSKDTHWQVEFESLFPYEETEDQLRAIQEVKQDMESDKVMDRLICGDVGYGKTEVAIRAVFKACMDSKQVAVLVPTTILAQQHYNNFKERFSNFPIRVEVLSRFKTSKDQKLILEDIKKGLVDVVIGTHRILSKDIQFKDLGLLVIDEEQRFGVRDKEKLKKLKTSIDVLTLSATPIPRTLHMSLSGVRDMSLIEQPPEERHPVLTYLVEAKDSIIADAIDREISRGGQVFFVYNRVNGIENMVAKIKSLVPHAKVAMGHGQMSSRELEKIMLNFLEKRYDVLVCTTIIETGMDIQNANTIIIYDADKMGLSQLYQLRGRVGRSSRQGYAYLLYEKDKVLSEVAEKRLKAIKEFTEFGSGFKIAMRDLEIRGAGNLLGSEQHGHMAAIGYDLYVKMLNEAIRKLKGEVVKKEVDTEIDININAYIPDYYIQDEVEKIQIYKKIASIETKEDMYAIEEEIEDRFSDIPQPLRNLLMIAYIKALGKKLKVELIKYDGQKVHLKPHYVFTPNEKNEYKLICEIAQVMEKMI
ncbi:transcription-repair coupling factor (superfamily II helicase) [Alkalithermobacter thermoalcaliphilus JW-YL-7 = DSM 7308]|uniref:Transcription-repair-coupling factor n=1 Tax=Alkalithermobacter thermoalcaliphilus JW-YL-7 = DSM 7308 TaxID=1121328 RepID=A0A150FSM1_CLOPD|nr:transcription-repair coupling factor [[Clostridium] paradoxum JW-YL-7 = DSM 7308]SHK69258.1 transcription-repair coupling factor (superfamily II helicase) [[Clostridium] paradoxum JW-YL-7 = DSM 7308]